MKSGRVFWAALFITVGLLGLLNNLSILTWSWSGLARFWPIVLILLGVAAIFRDRQFRWIFSGSAGVLLGLLGFAMVQKGCDVVDGDWTDSVKVAHSRFSEKYDSVLERASFSLDAGAGTFSVKDTTGELIVANCESNQHYELTNENTDSLKHVSLSTVDHNVQWHGRMRNTVAVQLNSYPEWDMNFDVGAAKLNLDLSAYKVRKISIDAGASSIDMKLGDRASLCTVDVETGVSSFTIRVPSTVDCEINTDASLSSRNFVGFVKLEPGTWRSENFGSKTKKLAINIDAGVLSITVLRYD